MSREYALHPFRAGHDLQINYAAELNQQQHAAVTAPPGPSLVIAGAGSGKTRTLTYRVAFLLEQGVPPDRILLLTFTNKAAREMMRRVTDLLGHELSNLWGGTFHSIGNRILRRHADRLQYQNDFSILDREDGKELINACVAESGIDIKATRFPKGEVLGDIFSLASNKQLSIAGVLEQEYDYFLPLTAQISELHRRYTQRKQKTNAMDFDDLISLWFELLQRHEDVREQYQRRFQFILVDEYQDTNKLQSDLIDLLGARHHNVMVVGDDSQSIYSWRGAHFQNILKFPDRYPEACVYKIETNYRSTPEILAVANAAIAPNLQQFSKVLSASRKSGIKPVLLPCSDSGQQSAFIAQRVLELRDEGVDLQQIAVLYRSHFHALELQLELTRRNIPFSITSGIRFFEQAHIKDVAAYLKFVTNPRDELSYKRLVRMLPGVGGKAAERLWKAFSAAADPGLPRGEEKSPIAVLLQKVTEHVPNKARVAWAQFSATISQLEAEQPVSKRILLVIEAGYEDYLKEEYSNYRLRLEDLEQLAAFAQQFSSVEEFLTQLALLTNVEAKDSQQASNDGEQLRLSTIHQAKGLEFEVVFIMMLCEGLFPSARSLKTVEGEEEERRLFYVAITRAKNELYLTYPLLRVTFGAMGEMFQQPSHFLEEIPSDLLDQWSLKPETPYG